MRNTACFLIALFFVAGAPLYAKDSSAEPTNPLQPASSEIEKLRKENAVLKAQNERITNKLKTAHATADGGNLIPVFVGNEGQLLGTKPTLRDQIAKSKVPTIEEATRIAVAHQVKEVGGLGANQSWSVTNLFRLGGEMNSFAKNGDLIWEVRIVRSFGPPQIGVNQIIWVNSVNGKAHSLIQAIGKDKQRPEKPNNAKQAKTDEHKGVNWLDYLKPDQNDLPRNVASKLSTLRQSKIATHDKARGVVGKFYFNATGDLTVKDVVAVTDLFELGANVNGFARKGDLVWQARVIKDGTGVVFSGWVSSTTGELRVISFKKPEKQDVHERSHDRIPDRLPGQTKEPLLERLRPNI